jgi:hypothetical protein
MVRPQKPINWDQFEQLCAFQCTQSEIASIFNVNVDTICDRTREYYGEGYSEVYKRFAETGKCSLRRNQFVLSKRNASLAIWLGKIWLGQKDPGLIDCKEDVLAALRAAVADIQREPRISTASGPPVENQQPLLDKERSGSEGEIPT